MMRIENGFPYKKSFNSVVNKPRGTMTQLWGQNGNLWLRPSPKLFSATVSL